MTTSDRLIKAAEEELLANQGQLEMLRVAKRAGLSVGVAYHHFGSKTGLIAAVVENFYAPLRDIMLGSAIRQDMEWHAREQMRVAAFVNYHYDHPFAPLVVGRLGREPEVLDIERAYMNELLDEGAKNIRQGQRAGAVPRDLNPRVTVAILMGGIRQALVDALLTDQKLDREALITHIGTFTEYALGQGRSNTHTKNKR